jgi:HAD superfamily hydrolase (TIGR01459 family)
MTETMTKATRLTFAEGMRDQLDHFDGLILDQWGVLHNGTDVYDGVVDLLKMLRKRDMPVAILTNSSKGEQANRDRLGRLGIGEDLYGPLVSTVDLLKAQILAAHPELRVYLLASETDARLFDRTGVPLVDTLDEATCVVMLTIPDNVAETPSSAEWLEPALARGLPLHTPSADVQSVIPGGGVVYGFHRTVMHYRARGGVVHLHGKPTSACYDTCRQRLGLSKGQRIAAVGDQFDTDVIGAVENSCTPIFVETGAAERDRGTMNATQWQRFLDRRCSEAGVSALTVLPSLAWCGRNEAHIGHPARLRQHAGRSRTRRGMP